jgi:hypothetical protein
MAYFIEVEQSIPKEWLRVSNIDPDGTFLEDAFHTKEDYSNSANDQGGRFAFENSINDTWPTPSGSAGGSPLPATGRPLYYRLHAAYSDTTDPSSWAPSSFTDQSLPVNRRSYAVIPVIVSAGPDGEFGMHVEVGASGAEPTDLSVRCGRVDGTDSSTLEQFSDNIVSLKQRSGVTQ